MSTRIIRKLQPEQLDSFFSLIQDVIKGLKSDGIDQWDEVYPARSDLAADLAEQTAYGYFAGDRPAAYIVLNEFTEPQYDEVCWEYETDRPLIIHRLSVHPDFKGKGIGTEMMVFAEDEAAARGYDSLRLDVYSENPAALRLYEKAGFRRAGAVSFRKGKFFLYEKKLSGRFLHTPGTDS